MSVASQVDAAFAAVPKDLGRLDIVVNNAGVSHVGPTIAETTDEVWSESVAVMQTGVFYCMRAAARHLLPQGSGSVVNISSIRGFSPNPGRIAYCATKAAVLMMTRVAAGEWAPSGVRVNAIAPGIQRTPMWDADVGARRGRRALLPAHGADGPHRRPARRSGSSRCISARTTPPTSPADASRSTAA